MTSSSSSPSSSPSSPTLPVEEMDVHPSLLCKYPSKKCWSRRALKRNGEMHNLCDLHREKANKNQRRLEIKRKTRGASSLAPGASSTPGEPRALAPRPRQRKRSGAPRGVLSTHLAMREEARARQLASLLELRRNTSQSMAAALAWSATSSAFETAYSSPLCPAEHPLALRISTASAGDEMDRALTSSWPSHADELSMLCGVLDAGPSAKATATLPTTSPVDVSDGWGATDPTLCWDLPVEGIDSSDIFTVARV